jgi:hypothetical protein
VPYPFESPEAYGRLLKRIRSPCAQRYALCALIPFRYVKPHKKPKADLTLNPDPTKIITAIRCPSGEIFPIAENLKAGLRVSLSRTLSLSTRGLINVGSGLISNFLKKRNKSITHD